MTEHIASPVTGFRRESAPGFSMRVARAATSGQPVRYRSVGISRSSRSPSRAIRVQHLVVGELTQCGSSSSAPGAWRRDGRMKSGHVVVRRDGGLRAVLTALAGLHREATRRPTSSSGERCPTAGPARTDAHAGHSAGLASLRRLLRAANSAATTLTVSDPPFRDRARSAWRRANKSTPAPIFREIPRLVSAHEAIWYGGQIVIAIADR